MPSDDRCCEDQGIAPVGLSSVDVGPGCSNSLGNAGRNEPGARRLVNQDGAHRPGNRLPEDDTTEHQLLQQLQSPADALKHCPSGKIHVHETTALDISATKLRQQIAEGITPRFLLPDAVWAYIRQNTLYGYRNDNQPND